MKELNGTIGRFRILGHWGTSSAGEVYTARDEDEKNHIYALTALSGRDSGLGAREHLAEAMRLQKRFRHPNIAVQREVIEHEGQLIVASDFVPGEPLNSVLRADRSSVLAVSLAAGIARILREAHKYYDEETTAGPMVHGDLTPDNVMITFDGKIQLVDFGVALARSRHTGARHPVGNPAYMSPERATGTLVLGGKSDIFSLGLILFEMFNEIPAYKGTTAAELLVLARAGKVPPLTNRARISPAIQKILVGALEADPSRRPSAEELSQSLVSLRSVRMVSFDLNQELTKLMDRRFQHKARAWKTLEARWNGQSVARIKTPARVRPTSLPEAALAEVVFDTSPSHDLPSHDVSPTNDIPARPVATQDLPRPQPKELSFVHGVVFCWLLVMALTASTLLWPTDWWSGMLKLVSSL